MPGLYNRNQELGTHVSDPYSIPFWIRVRNTDPDPGSLKNCKKYRNAQKLAQKAVYSISQLEDMIFNGLFWHQNKATKYPSWRKYIVSSKNPRPCTRRFKINIHKKKLPYIECYTVKCTVCENV